MLSRVADNMYWMARYLERAENTARVLDVNHTLLLDFHLPIEQQWMPILIIKGFEDFKEEPTAERVQEFLTWDEKNPFSIVSTLWWARENARTIREVISGEMWERMNYYHLWFRSSKARDLYYSSRHEFYSKIKRINQYIHGICDATMSYGEPREFFRLGTFLERASQTARILDVKYHTLLPKVEDVGTPADNAHWIAILMSCSGYEPYYKKLQSMPAEPGAAVADFLFYDNDFPRSIRRCLYECSSSLIKCSNSKFNAATQSLDELIQWHDSRTIEYVIREGLHESLTHIVESIHALGEAIRISFFEMEFRPPESARQVQYQ
jgi:uncharacterized alpha-E superfamily protein